MTFRALHPWCQLIYFVLVMLTTQVSSHPVYYGIALFCGLLSFACIGGIKKAIKSTLLFVLLIGLTALINPLFSHNGKTVLFYLNDNAVTVEAISYGLSIGLMLAGILCWFSVFNLVMTSDRLLYIFGSAFPKLGIVLTSALRLVPLFKRRATATKEAMQGIGYFTTDNPKGKLRSYSALYSSLVARTAEGSIISGGSMRARGYGLKGRSRFTLFRITPSDLTVAIFLLALAGCVISAIATGGAFYYYPQMEFKGSPTSLYIGCILHFVLCAYPFIDNIKEVLLWKYYRSKI